MTTREILEGLLRDMQFDEMRSGEWVKRQLTRAIDKLDDADRGTWKVVTNPCPDVWPGTWIAFNTDRGQGMCSLVKSEHYLSFSELEKVKRLMRDGATAGSF